MGGLLSCVACQAVQCCACAACNCCGRVVPCKSSVVTRAVYAVMFFVIGIVAWVLSNWGFDMLRFVPELARDCGTNTVCFGYFSIYRITFAVTCFHVLLAVLLIGVSSSKDCRFFIQGGSLAGWLVKIIIWLGGIVGCFFLPNVVFYYYAWIAVFGSCVFLLLQIVLLIEFAYSWNESWVAKWNGDGINENRNWFRLLLAVTVVLLLGKLALTILMYVFFTHGPVDCGLNIFFITFNLILCFVACICAVLPAVQEFNPRSGLLQAAVVVVYATWLVFSAINSAPPGGCNSLTGNQVANQATIIIGAIFTLVATVYSTVRAGSSSHDTLKGTTTAVPAAGTEETLLLPVDGRRDEESGGSVDGPADAAAADEVDTVTYSYTFFHITFALGAMYIAMLMTNWVVLGGSGDAAAIDSGIVSVWVKIVTGWLTLLLFLWTVFAPKILSGRDFS